MGRTLPHQLVHQLEDELACVRAKTGEVLPHQLVHQLARVTLLHQLAVGLTEGERRCA